MKNTVSYKIDKHYCIHNPNSSVKSTTCTTFHNTYKMYNYTEHDVSKKLVDDGLYKSVVLDEQTQQIYGFSPPKSIPNHLFLTNGCGIRNRVEDNHAYSEGRRRSPEEYDIYLINEIVEGVMVNLWYDSFVQRWEISTKNAVGGLENIYDVTTHKKTILEMFLDTINLKGCFAPGEVKSDGDLNHRIQEMKCWKMAYSYHFILQHPQMIVYPPNTIQPHHPIVGFVNSPTLYLVAIYHIQDSVVKYIPSCCFQSWEELSFPWLLFPRTSQVTLSPTKLVVEDFQSPDRNSQVTLSPTKLVVEDFQSPDRTSQVTLSPTKLVVEDYSEQKSPDQTSIQYSTLLEFYKSPYSEIHTTGAGIMITNLNTGERTKIVSEIFKKYRELRSNNPQWLFQYLCLNYVQRVDAFLQHYPCFLASFTQYQKQYISLIYHIHHCYMNKYVHRTKNRTKQFEENIDYLHNQVFLKYKILAVQPKRIITLDVVKEYVDLLSPMYLMNLLDARTIL